jgi:hypothetical protein
MRRYSLIVIVGVVAVVAGALWRSRTPGCEDQGAVPPPAPRSRASLGAAPAEPAPPSGGAQTPPPGAVVARHPIHRGGQNSSADPGERRQEMQRSRVLIQQGIAWLSERRANASRASRAEEAAQLAIRIDRLTPRLIALEEGRDPDLAR